jgi:hypothetical protein
LHAKGVDLFVLRARHVAALGQQQALEVGQIGACGLALAAQFVAKFAFESFDVARAPGVGRLAGTPGQPQQQQHIQRQ